MNLIDHLAAIDPSRCALVTQSARITFGQLCSEARVMSAELRGSRVVLNTEDLIASVCVLAAADGWAEAVVLTSPWHEQEALAPLIALARPHAVIANSAEALAAVDVRPPLYLDLRSAVAMLAGSAASRAATGQGLRTEWILTTSGTTGRPKMVRHNFSSLTRTTRCDTERGAVQVWGLVYDFTRFAGLQVVLQSLLSGARLVAPPLQVALDVKLSLLAAEGCTHLSATPTMWRKILMTPGAEALPLRQVTLGGEIADDAVLDSLARAFPQARISHIFASTEAGVGFSVSDGCAGFPVTFLTDPPSGIALRVSDGRLWVRNEEVGAAYLGDQGVLAHDGWVDTNDRVEVVGQRVYFRGRESGLINVGGDKVHPEEVERSILSHPDVALARVYAKQNPIMGALVAADIVARPGAPAAAELCPAILQHLRSRLKKHMIPVTMRFVENLDTNAAGKLRRVE
jgi:acyl-CoA synthetase (AMP-forming)/AMP-acid ligase II